MFVLAYFFFNDLVVYNYKDLFSTEPVVDESHCVSYW